MLVIIVAPGVLMDDRAQNPAALIGGAGSAVRALNDAGYTTLGLLDRFHPAGAATGRPGRDQAADLVRPALIGFGARLHNVVFPPEGLSGDPDPEAGAAFLGELLRRYRSAASDTVLITDSLPELRAAASLGCRRILVRTGGGAAVQAKGLGQDVLPVAVYPDLGAAADALLGNPP